MARRIIIIIIVVVATNQTANHLASRGSLPIPLPCSWTINVLRFVFSSSFGLPFELIERPANQTQYGFCNHQSNCVAHNELTSSQTTTWAWLQTEDSTHRGKDSPNREDDEPVQTYWRDSLNICVLILFAYLAVVLRFWLHRGGQTDRPFKTGFVHGTKFGFFHSSTQTAFKFRTAAHTHMSTWQSTDDSLSLDAAVAIAKPANCL